MVVDPIDFSGKPECSSSHSSFAAPSTYRIIPARLSEERPWPRTTAYLLRTFLDLNFNRRLGPWPESFNERSSEFGQDVIPDRPFIRASRRSEFGSRRDFMESGVDVGPQFKDRIVFGPQARTCRKLNLRGLSL